MNKLKPLFVFCLVLLFCVNSKADQLAYITETQAKEAVSFINNQKELILWCACCDNEPKKLVKVIKAAYQHTGYENYYEVVLNYSADGQVDKESLDLAYVWFKKGSKAHNVGLELSFTCSPCSPGFDW